MCILLKPSTYIMQGGDDGGEVLVLAASDVDVAALEGQRVSVRGTLDTSPSGRLTMLLLGEDTD